MFLTVFAASFVINTCVYTAEINSTSHTVNTDGEIVDITASQYAETGEWTDADFTGYDNLPVRISSQSNASVLWKEPVSQTGHKYEVYFWHCVVPNGDKAATVKTTSFTETATIEVDFSRGYSDWVRVGVLNLPDTLFSFEVTPSGDGGVVPVCAYKYVLTNDDEYYIDRIFDINSDLMVLMKDTYTALYNHQYSEIPDIAPTIVNDRTMLPIRFISENMGAEVIWNESDRSVNITYNDHNIVFYIDSTEYIVDGEQKITDQPPIIMNDRTMIPIRAFSEALGKQVSWNDNGVILIGDTVNIEENNEEQFYASVMNVFPQKYTGSN